VASIHVPQHLRDQFFAIPDSHRDRGIHLVAGSGSGKSLTLGLIAFLDFLRGVPQVLFDPTGQMIDAFLMYVAQFSKPIRRHLWPLIHYVDMSGRGDNPPAWPLLYGHSRDTRQDIADRFLQTCRAIDPNLESASIQGYNALYRVGAPTGVILSSLGLQLDESLDLLNQPEAWSDRWEEAERRHPEARAAAEYFKTAYLPLSNADRLSASFSYRAKVEPILLDPAMTAMFCTSPISVDFGEAVRLRQTILLDFRGETNDRKRLLKTRWAYDCLVAYIRHRGPGRHRPLAIHFDEITELTNQSSLEHDLFTRDLDYLFNVLQRNYSCWITAAHQQMWQLSERTQQTLMSLGTQVVGVVSDIDTAEALARQYAPLDPKRIKRYRKVWMKTADDHPFVVDREPIDFPMHEQTFVAAREFMRLKPFDYLVMPRHGTAMKKVSVAGFVGTPWPNQYPRELAYIRRKLSQRQASPLVDVRLTKAPESALTSAQSRDITAPDTMRHATQRALEQNHDAAEDDFSFWDTSQEADGV
jgi:hypothetical protein